MAKKKYCILGESLKHTMSPPIHQRLFELKNRQFDYEIVEVTPDALEKNSKYLNSLSGYNVTIPHKISIINYLDNLDETAKRYGAVNCVDNKNGVLTGYNTDVDGFLRSLSSAGGKLDGKTLLLGSGGVGRMMGIEACRHGSDLTIAVLEKMFPEAERVKSDILIQVPDAKVEITTFDKITGHYDLLINATPVGMFPTINACVVSDEVIKNVGFVFDAIYNPKTTLLMKKADMYGVKNIGGMAMLVWQAVSAHEIWDSDSYTDEQVQHIIDEMQILVERDFK